jgi:hypothetical protein
MRRKGCRYQYVSERYTHSAGPKRKRRIHPWLKGICNR